MTEKTLSKFTFIEKIVVGVCTFLVICGLSTAGVTYKKANENETQIKTITTQIVQASRTAKDNKKILCLMALNSFENKKMKKEAVSIICSPGGTNGPTSI